MPPKEESTRLCSLLNKLCARRYDLIGLFSPLSIGLMGTAAIISTLAVSARVFSFPAQAGKCPADPFKASTALWNWGDLRTGEVRTCVHPCGRNVHRGKVQSAGQAVLSLGLDLEGVNPTGARLAAKPKQERSLAQSSPAHRHLISSGHSPSSWAFTEG
jgi:hypothetical protein